MSYPPPRKAPALEAEIQRRESEKLIEYSRKLDEKLSTAKQRYEQHVHAVQGPASLAQTSHAAGANTTPVPTGLPTLPQAMKQKRPLSQAWFHAAAAAVILGLVAGLAFVHRDTLFGIGLNGADDTPPVASALRRKPAAAARLFVQDVSGELNSEIPLQLVARPASADQPITVTITGLPPSAYLTRGRLGPDGTWLVQPEDIADLKLVVTATESPRIDLQVAAVNQASGALAAPTRYMSVTLSNVTATPANEPPQGQSNAQPLSAPADAPGTSADLLARGDSLMKQGDVLGARQYYLWASAAGLARGSLGVARSYDPKVLAAMKIVDQQPDAAKAMQWYKKALEQGLPPQP